MTTQVQAIQSSGLGELTHYEQRVASISLDRLITNSDVNLQKSLDKQVYSSDCSDEEGEEALYKVINGTAIINISGPLLSTSSFWSKWLGYTSYQDIRAQVMAAAANPEVQDIMLMMATPGGSVFGITDGADAISKANAIKPVYAYSNQNCCSAGYWLACATREIITSPESETGSIGVIVVHKSFEKQLESDGIKITEIKSSALKAVGGPFHDLTEQERSHIQEQVSQLNDLFQTHVHACRPQVKYSAMNGQTFFGAEAVKNGIVDKIMTYDQVMQYIQSKRTSTQNGGYGMKMTAVQLQTALDAGQTLADLQLSEDEAKEILAAKPEVTEAEVAAEDDGAKKGKGKGKGKGGCATPEDETALSALTEQLTAQATIIADKDKQIADLQSQVTDFEAHAADLKKIVAEVTTNRRVALGLMGSVDLTTFTVPTLLAEYSAITEQFSKAMKIGGLFGGKDTTKTTPPAPVAVAGDSIENGRLQASSI